MSCSAKDFQQRLLVQAPPLGSVMGLFEQVCAAGLAGTGDMCTQQVNLPPALVSPLDLHRLCIVDPQHAPIDL